MTEPEARALLRDCNGFGWVEAWIAGQRWQVMPGEGWGVMRDLQGWRFRLAPAPPGLRLRVWPPGGDQPAEWEVVASIAETESKPYNSRL